MSATLRLKKAFPGFGSLVLGVYGTGKDKGKLIYAGRVGTGFSIKKRLEFRRCLIRLPNPRCRLRRNQKIRDLRDAHWAKPKLIAEVEFTEWTDDGSIRHPSFQGLREDKKPADVIREEPTALIFVSFRVFHGSFCSRKMTIHEITRTVMRGLPCSEFFIDCYGRLRAFSRSHDHKLHHARSVAGNVNASNVGCLILASINTAFF